MLAFRGEKNRRNWIFLLLCLHEAVNRAWAVLFKKASDALINGRVFLMAQNTLFGDLLSSPHSLQPSPYAAKQTTPQHPNCRHPTMGAPPSLPQGMETPTGRVRVNAEPSTSPSSFILLYPSIKQAGFSCCCFAKLSFPAHDSG